MPFLEKSIKKALLSTFRALFALLQNRNGWKTDKNLNLAERLQLFAVKNHFQLKFCA